MKTRLALTLSLFPVLTAAPAFAQTPNPGVDSDGDSVNDAADAEPCDPRVALKRFDPADRTWGMLLFEDSWPSQGDFDFNDAVLAYNQVLDYDSTGLLTGIRLDVRVMAVGAHFQNGLAFRLPGANPSSVNSLELYVNGQPQSSVGLRSGESDVIVDLTNDLHGVMGSTPGNFVNTDPMAPTSPYADIVLLMTFSPGHGIAPEQAPYDLFLFNVGSQTEVHLPRYGGTSAMDASLLGTADDGSTANRHFVTQNGIPFALEFPEEVLYPMEYTSIATLFPGIVDFGRGVQGSELFYRNPNLGAAFGNVTPGAFRATAGRDVTCFAADPGRCGTAADAPSVDAPYANLCSFGTASAVTTSGGLFRWTCTGFYSNPTSCNTPDLVCQPGSSQGCSIPNGTGSQVCNGSGSGFGSCTAASCNSGYYLSGNSCVQQVCTPNSSRTCTISNGSGVETCDNLGSRWHSCTATGCNNGFSLQGNTCVSTVGADADSDGLSDSEEQALGTNASSQDTDGDGIRDGTEVAMGRNPRSSEGRPSASGTAVSSCGTLSSGGNYYLTRDISNSSGDCIVFDSSNITLDCRGHRISGGGSGSGIYLYVFKGNSVIRNCEVTGFRAGVYLYVHNYDVTLESSNLHHNVEYGIQTQHHNYRTRIDDTRATFNGSDGFHLDDHAAGVALRNNHVTDNGGNGILIYDPNYSSSGIFGVCGNTVRSNVGCQYRISGYGSATLQIPRGCHDPAPAESACTSVCTPRTTRSCTIPNGQGTNACNAVGTGWSPGCDYSHCNPGYGRVNGACVSLGTDSDNDGISDSEESSHGTNRNSADTDGDGITDGTELAMRQNASSSSSRPGGSGIALSSCQDLSSGTYYLNRDVTMGSGRSHCFQFNGNNITLDCRGHAIIGDGTGVGVYVYGHEYDGRIRNCEIRNFRAGIYLYVHNYRTTVENNNLHHNTEYGLQLQHHNHMPTVQRNRATFNGSDGLHLDDHTAGATVRANVTRNNGSYGIQLHDPGDGYWFSQSRAYICGNESQDNLGAAFYVRGSNSQFSTGTYASMPSQPSCN